MHRLVLAGLLVSVVPLSAAAAASGAPAHGPHFERVGSEGGQPSAVVTALYQDRVGFVWIGSRDGLTAYDGHSFTAFVHDPSDTASISDDAIRTVFEDRQGNLWIGTNTGGLDRLDRASGKFERFRHDSRDPRSLSHDSVYAIAEDPGGTLWVGTQRGLNRFDPITAKFDRFLADPSVPGSLSHNYVSSLLVDRRGRLWVGTVGGGLDRFDPATGRFEVWRHDPSDPRSLGDYSVFCLLESPTGTLWIGTNAGLDRMDPESGTIRHHRHEPANPLGLGHPIVTSLAAGLDGRIWVGTFGGGLAEMDEATGAIRSFRHEERLRASLPADRVLALLADRAGALWVGTWGGGLSRVSGSALLLAAGSDEVPEPSGLDDRDVTGLARDRDGGLWVGTRNGVLLRREARTGAYRTYTAGGLGSILRILQDRAGSVWVGTTTGLLRLDPETGALAEFRHDSADPASLGPGFVPALLEDGKGRLWVGTGEGGLQEIARDGRVLRRFAHDSGDPATLSDDYVTAISEDRAGTLWVGTRSGGVNAVDPRTGRTTRHRPDPSDPHAISHHNVTAILQDSKGRLWIATGGGGLNRADRTDNGGSVRFVRFTAEDGLVDNNVMAILEDDDGSLWLSTKRGISRFAPDRGTFTNYFVADGLPTGEFEFGAAARTGRALHFGSVSWVVTIPAGTPLSPALDSPTVVTSIRSREGEIRGDRPPWSLERLEIPYGTWFSVEVAVLDFNAEHTHAHAYRLGRGGKDEWIVLGSRREITFADLDPGRYEFVARGRNCQGVWSATSAPLAIHVVPPFWMTAWFRFLVAIGIVAAALVIHQARLSVLERRNRELVHLHEQREQANRELAVAYERLQTLARRLEAAKEEERKEIARELHDDLGPALTAVVINLQLLGKDRNGDHATRRIQDSIDLVDRMVQQIRDLSLDLRPPLLDEMGLVSALKGYMETQAERTGLEIAVEDAPPLEGVTDEVAITVFRVAQEAVTNAIRHAGARKIGVALTMRDGGLEVRVEDDGKGFDVRSTLEGPVTGRNLGLLGMQERAHILGGRFDLDSSPGRGTRVRAWIPLEART